MAAMPPTIAYTIRSSPWPNNPPYLDVGYGSATQMWPSQPQEDSYWIVFISRTNPKQKVKDFVIPGQNNSTVPPDLENYLKDANNIYAVATQTLSTLHVPQGPLYGILTKYGAGRELQKLEQLNTVLSCGTYSQVNYVMTSQGGSRDNPKIPPPASYEMSDYHSNQIVMMMSLTPRMNGSPPYSISDTYTFKK